jgi:hypothetical protein
MQSVRNWYLAEPSSGFRPSFAIFHASTSVMLISLMILTVHNADLTRYGGFEVGSIFVFLMAWTIFSVYLHVMLNNSMSLSERVAQLEQQLKALPQPPAGSWGEQYGAMTAAAGPRSSR